MFYINVAIPIGVLLYWWANHLYKLRCKAYLQDRKNYEQQQKKLQMLHCKKLMVLGKLELNPFASKEDLRQTQYVYSALLEQKYMSVHYLLCALNKKCESKRVTESTLDRYLSMRHLYFTTLDLH